jgi:hypothetical protein
LRKAPASGIKGASPLPTTEKLGTFEMYPDGLRVARGPDWATATGEPFVLACDGDASRHDRSMVCAASDAFGAGLRRMFTFRTSGAEVEADARGIRGYQTISYGSWHRLSRQAATETQQAGVPRRQRCKPEIKAARRRR